MPTYKTPGNENTPYGQYIATHGNRGFDWRQPALALGGPLAAAAAPALGGSLGALGGGGSAINTAVPPAVKGASSGFLLPAIGMAASTIGSLFGIHKQSQQNTAAMQAQERANQQAQLLAQQDYEERKREFDAQQAQAKLALDAQNKFQADQFKAQEDERLYQRTLSDKQQALLDAREARRAPRYAAAAAALGRLSTLGQMGGR